VSHLLSKSKYLLGLQCPKLLWTQLNRPDSIPAVDTVTQHMFDQGHLVGQYAKQLFPDGVDIPHDGFMENITATRRLLAERRPLFEAGILYGSIYSRVDILEPVDDDEWDIVEIKSSTSVKDVHIDDISFQRYCCEKAGLKIRVCKVGFLNREYVKKGSIEPEELFVLEDVSAGVEEACERMDERVLDLLQVPARRSCPEVTIGRHCLEPYECSLRPQCWAFLPRDSIFELRGGPAKQFALYERGIMSIRDIPDDIVLSRQQQIQKECVITGKTHVDREEIRLFLDSLRYPLHFLDFETIAPAIPIHEGMKPYQALPFQFSLHIVENERSGPTHHSFLADGLTDPRPAILCELRELLGSEGSIVAYNASFEEDVLSGLADTCPSDRIWLQGLLSRTVDLLRPFSGFHYYHPAQKDSASLKRVLAAVTGKGYEELSIGDGMEASAAYARMMYGSATEEEITRVRADLTEYCKLDTEAMIRVVDELRMLAA
jgi:hypothetical protein